MEKTYKQDIWGERNKGNLTKIHYKNQKLVMTFIKDFPGLDSKAPAYNAEARGLIPGWRRSSGEGNGNPLQYSCL